MDRLLAIDFLREKTRLCAAFLNQGSAFIERQEWSLQEIRARDDFDQQANYINRELDTFIRGAGGKKGVAETQAILKAKYGFANLGQTGEAIAKKVLKRGNILTLEEAQVIHDVLADVDWCDEFGQKRSQKLEAMLWKFNEANNPRPKQK